MASSFWPRFFMLSTASSGFTLKEFLTVFEVLSDPDLNFPLHNGMLHRPSLFHIAHCTCLVVSAAALGIRRIFIINGHHGNQKALEDAKTMANRACKAKTHVFSYWKFMDRGFDHAGHIETSLMLAISKNTRMNKAIKGFEEPTGAKLKEASRRAEKSFVSVTKNGIWGDPRGATASEGRKMLAIIVKNLEKKCRACSR